MSYFKVLVWSEKTYSCELPEYNKCLTEVQIVCYVKTIPYMTNRDF